jgi:hypothetical protein
LKPLHDVAPVVAEHVGEMPYPALNSAFDALVPPGLQHYWKANFLGELNDAVVDAHLAHGPKVPVVRRMPAGRFRRDRLRVPRRKLRQRDRRDVA